jgi:hypothetical protein
MDHLRDLALFVAVAEAKSFTKAAAQLGVPTWKRPCSSNYWFAAPAR